MAKVIIAIHAHPDDIEILAAGTLALLAAKGHKVVIATATAGEGGSSVTGPEETARVRKLEAQAAALEIGATYRCAGLPDLGVFNTDDARRKITEVIRWAVPDIVLAPSSQDYHPDHEAVSLLVRDACFAASVPNYHCGESPALRTIPHLYFTDAIGGRDRDGHWITADFGVDIDTAFAAKSAMLSHHVSQRAWVARQHGVNDQQADMEAWTRRRGRDFGVALAEGFRQYRQHPYPGSPLLQDLVGECLLAPFGERHLGPDTE